MEEDKAAVSTEVKRCMDEGDMMVESLCLSGTVGTTSPDIDSVPVERL